ncbi:CHAP domain-containing protein [Clostridium sp.]|uniref:CHAP domain-containing protein n=1 Tax=Clostridium sp. TaxID=1506 RepID=UPI002617E6D9|nr:CHAP domain-containing protein [Clostridium sp.]
MKREFIKKVILTGIVTLTITNMYYVSASAKWINDAKSNWNWMENGVKATGWKSIDNKWYYFDTDGVMSIGWINYNGDWYYLSDSGEMSVGWKNIDGKWYYLNEDGKMSVGWINDNGTWYFTNSSGEMKTGSVTINGKVYTFSDSGAVINSKDISEGTQNQTESPDISNVQSKDNLRTAYVSTNDGPLNIRSKASLTSDTIGTLDKGTEVKILDSETNGFYPIVMNGQEGWVSSKWVSFDKAENTNTNTSTGSSSDSNNNLVPPPISDNDNKDNTDNKNDTDSDKETDLKDDSLVKGVIRDTAPSLDNKHYYSDDNLFYKIKLSPPFSNGGKVIKGNCTWYAWGRAWELTGKKPDDAGFIGNAYEWWNDNKKSGKYQYGSEPRVGAIAVWKSDLPNSGGSGHVAIVEKISNGKIYISESTWNGEVFRYREIYETDYLYGYIYLDKPNF